MEKVTLTGESHQNDLHRDKRKEEKDDGGQVFPPSPSKKEANGDHLVDFDVLAAFAADSTVVFCALPIVEDEGGRVLFGTSQVSGGGAGDVVYFYIRPGKKWKLRILELNVRDSK